MPLLLCVIGCILLYLVYLLIEKLQQSKRLTGKALRRKLAQSRKEFIGKSEAWHWQRATKK